MRRRGIDLVVTNVPPLLIEQLGKLEDFERTVLEKARREHRERAAYLAFIRDHIDPDVVYRLEPSDLRMIDLAPLTPAVY